MMGEFEKDALYPITVQPTGDSMFRVVDYSTNKDYGKYPTSLEAWNKAVEIKRRTLS